MKQAKKKDIAEKLAEKTHTSKRIAMQQLPYFQEMFKRGSCPELVEELELSKEEVEWLEKWLKHKPPRALATHLRAVPQYINALHSE